MGVVVLVDRPGYRLAADSKVVKASEATIMEQTAQAYVLAQDRINTALRDLEEVQKKVTAEAYREGMAKAERDAAQRWTLAELDRHTLLRSMQPALAEVVVEAVALLASGIDREALFARALEALRNALRDVSWALLKVHPASVQEARSALSRFDRQTGLGRIANVVADESLSEGGCVLESELGRIDASVSTQLENIRSALVEAAGRVAS
jgi:type III secretion protein L